MNALYVLGGIACLAYGIWQTITEINIFRAGKQDKFGWDIKGLGVGVCFVMLGVSLITHYI